jgi:hypothetical protein
VKGIFFVFGFFMFSLLNESAGVTRVNKGTILAFEPAERRGEIDTDMIKLIIMKELNVIGDVLEIAEFIILKSLLFVGWR